LIQWTVGHLPGIIVEIVSGRMLHNVILVVKTPCHMRFPIFKAFHVNNALNLDGFEEPVVISFSCHKLRKAIPS